MKAMAFDYVYIDICEKGDVEYIYWDTKLSREEKPKLQEKLGTKRKRL